MRRYFQCAGFFAVTIFLVLAIKALNPPSLDYKIDYSVTIDCIEGNLSGISYNPDSGDFFVISNYPEEIIEITNKGECLNQYPLLGFTDTEDLFYLGDNKFLLVQERQQTIDLMEIKPDQIEHLQSLALRIDAQSNKGLEGITYNQQSNSIFFVNERPQKLLKVVSWTPMSGFKKVETVNSFTAELLLKDYSAVTDSGQSLLLLSDQSSRLLELDYDGRVKARFDLLADEAGDSSLNQPEGIAMDTQKNIYVVSEPNLLYVYKKNQLLKAGSLVFNAD